MINFKNKAITQNFAIPTNLSSTVTNSNTTFLLLNNEFHNQTYLSGFQLYAASNASITIKVFYLFIYKDHKLNFFKI